ncbi:putative monosaccharide-P-dolichol utilization protein [Trichodelitschia bisporula]|uniref:Mannose-P-dolichol utilization defect 1 protein homolog n=1 Tax=Trichodelitschia bisporula TaxID=703511 RepID=A0A6G1I3Y9_9PEZI|nr:putative monosaccharide-P-dolichol utilization protein [Trichodelitschia bisporula]
MDSLRSALQPVTANLPAPIRDIGVNLLGTQCYKNLILDIDPVAHPDCLKLAVSKALGIGIIGASSIVKVPQLLKLINSQSAAGVSFLSYLLETSAFLITLAYNARQGNPFSTYGESALIAAQNVAIASLVLHYSGKGAGAAAFVAGLGGAVYAMFSENIVDAKTLALLQAGAGVLGVASKLPQILTIWQQGGTGQLSAFAVFNYLAGSLSRIFTTLQEVNDPLILYGFIAGFTLNAVLAAQMVYYWNAPAAKQKAPAIKIQGAKGEPVAVSSGAQPKGRSPSTRRRA